LHNELLSWTPHSFIFDMLQPHEINILTPAAQQHYFTAQAQAQVDIQAAHAHAQAQVDIQALNNAHEFQLAQLGGFF
jgi:hypothetical protein